MSSEEGVYLAEADLPGHVPNPLTLTLTVNLTLSLTLNPKYVP